MKYFRRFLHGGFNVDCPIDLNMICFSYFQWLHVRVTSCLTSKILYIPFHTKTCDSIQNYVNHGKKQLSQEVGDRYVCHNVKPLKTVCNYCAKICD